MSDNTGALNGPLTEYIMMTPKRRTIAHGQFTTVIVERYTDEELAELNNLAAGGYSGRHAE